MLSKLFNTLFVDILQHVLFLFLLLFLFLCDKEYGIPGGTQRKYYKVL